MDSKKPWYKSKGVNGAILVLVTLLSILMDVEVGTEEVQQILEYFGLGIGGVLALWGRITAKEKVGLTGNP